MPTPALQLAGRRFGKLTALHVVEKSRLGYMWLLQCDCGGLAIRRAAALTVAEKNGATSSCRTCGKRRSDERFKKIRNERAEYFAAMFEATGALWSTRSDHKMHDQILGDYQEVFGYSPAVDLSPLSGYTLGDAIEIIATVEGPDV
jgi:hypothetical protein